VSNEFFTQKGKKKMDAELHNPILGNVEANKAIAQRAIIKAVMKGVPSGLAQKLYGHNPELDTQ
jgi:hypothetical protein